ncbi:helix-turn-helix domain-containing protein [Weissella viridescens]|uniref:helix-turn-helix domain-containing protein n=1 Tax=Weissella viridescens TaxID=1629 RepID=UPI004057615B
MIVKGSLLKQRREQLGISQGQLAEGICHQSMVSRVEKRGHITSMTVLKALCMRLHIDISQVAELTTENHVQLSYVRELVECFEYKQAKKILESTSFMQNMEDMVMPEFHLLKAICYSECGEPQKTLHFLQMAMSGTLHTQTGLLIEIFNEMGGVWIKLNELDSAKDCLERCLNLTNSLPEAKAETLKLVIVKVYRRKAELAVALEQYAEAIEWVDQAMSVLPKVNAYHELVRLQKIKIESAEELDQQSEKKEAMLLAYAAGLFSQDQKLEEETRHYRSEMDSK